jgi:hypothetical protein
MVIAQGKSIQELPWPKKHSTEKYHSLKASKYCTQEEIG